MIKHVLWAATVVLLTLIAITFAMDLLRPDSPATKGWGEITFLGIIGWSILMAIVLFSQGDGE